MLGNEPIKLADILFRGPVHPINAAYAVAPIPAKYRHRLSVLILG
jgi:hypothetical protein